MGRKIKLSGKFKDSMILFVLALLVLLTSIFVVVAYAKWGCC